MRLRFLNAIGLLLLAAAVVTAPAAAQSEDWNKVVAAAKKEGRVVYYGTSTDLTKKLASLFEKKYGIQVDTLNLRPTELRERVRSEQSAGRYMGDVVSGGLGVPVAMAKLGQFEPYGDLPLANKVEAPFENDGTLLMPYATAAGILINTNMVKPEDEPKSWRDLLDPKWKGKILMFDPRQDGMGQVFFGVTYYKIGADFQEKFATTQNPTLAIDSVVDQRRVGAGEFPMYLLVNIPDFVNLKGLPVKIVFPTEGAAFTQTVYSVLKNAPHPNAARLYMNFLMEDEAQQEIVKDGRISAITAMNQAAPEHLRPLVTTKLLGATVPDTLTERFRVARELYK